MDVGEIGAELPRFDKWRPTGFDARGLGSEGQEAWRVLPVMQTRDSGCLDQSNFASAVKALEAASVEHEIHRFGHWGSGWFEIVVVEPTPEGLKVAGEIASSLASYPILNEDDLSERETAHAWEAWQHGGFSDFCRASVADYELAESTADWLADVSEAELDLALRFLDAHSGEYYGHSENYSIEHSADRDAFAGLLREMRKARKSKE